MEKYKKVQEKKELYIQFSEEEMQELGWEEGQKLSFKFDEETKAITLEPFVKVELEMETWPRELLLFLIQESCEKDVSVNEVISNTLEQSLKIYDKQKQKN
jgi:hypothetical protein